MAKQTPMTYKNDNRGYYVPSDYFFEHTDIKDLRKEYTRLRDIYRKRIDRLEKAGVTTPRNIEKMRAKMPKIADLELDKSKDMREHLKRVMSNVSHELNKGRTTLPEARQKLKDYKDAMNEIMAREFPEIDPKEYANIDPITFFDFLEYTKDIIKDGFIYWTTAEVRLLFDVDGLKRASESYEADNEDFREIADRIRGYQDITGKEEVTR